MEGEEELRADHLLQLVTEQSALLAADVAAVSDAGFFEADVPLTTGLRGMAALNFSLRTANTDLHSGIRGNRAECAARHGCVGLGAP